MAILDDLVDGIETYLAGLVPPCLHGSDAARVVEVFSRGERLCAAGRILAARQVAATNAWRADGHRSPEEWLADKTGQTRSSAQQSLQTGRHLEKSSATTDALLAGQLSETQAAEVASAAAADPAAEGRLLAEAQRSGVTGLRKSCQAVRQAAKGREQLADRERVHRSRYLRTWNSGDGALEGRFRLTADHGAILLSALDREYSEVFAQARISGQRDPAEAYEADALVNLARHAHAARTSAAAAAARQSAGPPAATDPVLTGDGAWPVPTAGAGLDGGACPAGADAGGSAGPDGLADPHHPFGSADHATDTVSFPDRGQADPDPLPQPTGSPAPPSRPLAPPSRPPLPPAVINVRVDYQALKRGYTKAGETCEITGIGPVPVETARRLAADAFLRILIVDNHQVIHARNAGRTISTALRAALEERDRACAVPGCDCTRHLEIHHLHPFALGGPTTLTNTARICPAHHDQITYHGATLTGTAPDWAWHPPGQAPSPPAPVLQPELAAQPNEPDDSPTLHLFQDHAGVGSR